MPWERRSVVRIMGRVEDRFGVGLLGGVRGVGEEKEERAFRRARAEVYFVKAWMCGARWGRREVRRWVRRVVVVVEEVNIRVPWLDGGEVEERAGDVFEAVLLEEGEEVVEDLVELESEADDESDKSCSLSLRVMGDFPCGLL